jgi:hypothetical protein
MTSYLIFDSGALINLTINGLIQTMKDLATVFTGEFLITEEIEYETIEHPLHIKKYEWGALRVKDLLDEDIIMLAEGYAVTQKELKNKTDKIMSEVNAAFTSNGKPIHLIEKGEAECMALSELLNEKGIDAPVVIDERTARMLCEDPEKLRKLMEAKLRTKIEMKKDNLRNLEKIKVIRSTELMYIAHKKGLIDGNDERLLEAILFALKYGGCSISEKEINIIKNL